MAKRKRAERGAGSVYFDNANRVWWARVSLGVVNGKRIGKKVRCATEREANAELETLRRTYAAGGDPSQQTLDEYLADWLRDHGPTVRASTLVSYTGHVQNHISPLLGGIPLRKLRASDVRRLIADRLAAGKSPATVGRIVTTLRIALTQATRDRVLIDNPAAAVRLPRVEAQPVAALTEDEADRIVDAAQAYPEPFMGPLVALLLGTGIRLGEACGLDWGDVDLERSFVLVRVSKTKVRAVPMSDTATAALRKHKAAAKRYGPAEPVFVGPRTTDRLRGQTVSHAFPKMLTAAGLERLTPHGLRHGAASLMIAKGAHMRVVAEQLGHANPAMTAKVYAHVLPESQRDAVRLLNRREAASE